MLWTIMCPYSPLHTFPHSRRRLFDSSKFELLGMSMKSYREMSESTTKIFMLSVLRNVLDILSFLMYDLNVSIY